MRARVTNPGSLFRGEEGEVLHAFEGDSFGSFATPAYLIALDSRGFGNQRLGLCFKASEVVVLAESFTETVEAHFSGLERQEP